MILIGYASFGSAFIRH